MPIADLREFSTSRGGLSAKADKVGPIISAEERVMTVRTEKSGPVWTVIHSRPNDRNAMDPASADALNLLMPMRPPTLPCCGAKAALSARDGI